jgi:DNA polymerase-3 subunit alpha
MQFATFLDREGKVFDAVAFPSVAQKGFFRGLGIYKCKAVVVEEFGYYSLNLINAEKLPMLDDPRYSENTRIKRAQSNLI